MVTLVPRENWGQNIAHNQYPTNSQYSRVGKIQTKNRTEWITHGRMVKLVPRENWSQNTALSNSQYSWGRKNWDKEWITDKCQNLSVELLVSGYDKQYLFRGGAKYLLFWGQGGQLSRGGWDRAVQIINEPGGLLWLLCRILSIPVLPFPRSNL